MSTDAKPVEGKPGLDWYTVNEVFTSIQGEGTLVGLPATFIRLQGCPVGCVWCDSGPLADLDEDRRLTNGQTRNTWGKGGLRMSVSDIMRRVEAPHVIITGGEPMIWDLDSLLGRAKEMGCSTQVETSGYCDFKGGYRPTFITWSPKQNLGWTAPEVFRLRVHEVKWVVDTDLTLDTVMSMYEWYTGYTNKFDPDPPTFVLMPEGSPPKQENIHKVLLWLKMVPFEHRKHFRYGQRLQYTLGLR